VHEGPYDRKKQSALHVVSAWASEHRLLLGQVKVEDKTNEIKAIPLLELLDITGCVITIDAMGTQTDCDPDCGQRRRLYFEPQSQSSLLLR